MGRRRVQPSLFRYRNYRRYLQDWYHATKESERAFSFRAFSKRAGFKSPNMLKLVMDGERNLSEESVKKFCHGLKLNKQEAEFFENLVYFNQAETHTEKSFYYQRLLQSRKFSQLKLIERDQYDYYSTWYHPVVRELVVSEDYDGTPEWIASRVSPAISPLQAQKSIQLLEDLGFIEKGKNGRWHQATSLVSTADEVSSVILMNYHLTLLDLTKDVLAKLPPEERDVGTVTLGIRREHIPMLKDALHEFRNKILKFAVMEEAPDEVVQINLQMFPLTHSKKGETS